jgi:site-specific recombinase XerD
MASKGSSLEAAQRWVESHASSKHTCRKYESQLQQLCEWLLVRELDLVSVMPEQIAAYLVDVGAGRANSLAVNPSPRSARTVTQTRSILRSLFKSLVLAGHRPSNPIDYLAALKVPDPVQQQNEPGPARWADIRSAVLLRTPSSRGERNAMVRAVAIAELAYWVGLRRSEMASCFMSDFVKGRSTWRLRVLRFGRGAPDILYVPSPAMRALSRYRMDRGLAAWPSAIEKDVPMISRLRSERPVDAWTVANALRTLDVDLSEPMGAIPSMGDLRRELVVNALRVNAVPPHQLAAHIRSRQLVNEISDTLPLRSAGEALERLAA